MVGGLSHGGPKDSDLASMIAKRLLRAIVALPGR
jgi:hypothetical protein